MVHKILIADDEVHIRILLEQTLEDLVDAFDIQLLFASDGDEALALIRQEIPHLVFLDIMMPKRDGYEVCQAVTQDPEIKDTKIILLTAKGQETDRSRGASSGALYYITKPFDPDHVLGLAKKILNLE
jgi:two-component system, OmpR family, alkaline phosphatase synthesis response regulator PhoP